MKIEVKHVEDVVDVKDVVDVEDDDEEEESFELLNRCEENRIDLSSASDKFRKKL